MLRRDNVSDEPLLARDILTRDNSGFADKRVVCERVLDFSWLDAESANLDLAINPPEEIERSVRAPTSTIARAI